MMTSNRSMPSDIRSLLDEVFMILADSTDNIDRLIVQMGKILLALSTGNSTLFLLEVSELVDMTSYIHSNQYYSTTSSIDRDKAILVFARSFATVLSKTCMPESMEQKTIKKEIQDDDISLNSLWDIEKPMRVKCEPADDSYPLLFNTFNHDPSSSLLIDEKSDDLLNPQLIPFQSINDDNITSKEQTHPYISNKSNDKVVKKKGKTISSESLGSFSSPSITFHCPLYSVGVCSEGRQTAEDMYKHVQEVHRDFALPFSCLQCNTPFRYKHEVRDHNESHHSTPINIRFPLYIPKLYFVKNTQCVHCSWSTQSSRLFILHHSSEHPACSQSHLSCNAPRCRRRFKFFSPRQLIYHYGQVGNCKGQSVMIED